MAVAVAGLAWGWPMAAVAVAIAAAPVAGFVLAGHVPGRGAAVGCLAMGLAATLVRPESGEMPWGGLILLAGIGLSALVAGARIDGLAAPLAPTPAAPSGGWMTIIVECEDPSEPTGVPSRPRVSPSPLPERRSVARLAGGHGRERCAVSVG